MAPRGNTRGLLIGALLVCLPVSFWLGSLWQQGRLESAAATERIEPLEHEMETLRQQIAVLKSAEQVSQQANEQSRLTIKLLEEQIYKQQQDLSFYKGVVAPDRRQDQLNIKAFELLPTDSVGLYRYKVLLNRMGKGDKPLQGRLHITVLGKQDGKALSLPLADLSGDLPGALEQPIGFVFKHFQAIPEAAQFAELQLPQGFIPEQVSIKADIDGQKPVVQTFQWSKKE